MVYILYLNEKNQMLGQCRHWGVPEKIKKDKPSFFMR